MSKFIITGGSGFIGTNLIEYLLKTNRHTIKNIDINNPPKKEHLKNHVCIDICNQSQVEKEFTDFDPDYVIHMAARCDLNGKSTDDYSANSIGVYNVLSAAKKCNSLKKIIITSSMLVCEPGYAPKHEHDYKPSTIYGESKIKTEEEAWNANLDMDWAIVRPTSIWGPWFGEPYKLFFEMIKAGHYIHIENNNACMTYGYVENAIHQLMCILCSDTTHGDKVFYLGDYDPTPIEAWADEIASCFGRHIATAPRWAISSAAYTGDVLKKIGISFPITSFRLNNMTKDNIIDLSKTKKVAPKLPFSRFTGVKKTVEWLEKQV